MSFHSVLILVHEGFTGKRPNALHALVFKRSGANAIPQKIEETYTHIQECLEQTWSALVERLNGFITPTIQMPEDEDQHAKQIAYGRRFVVRFAHFLSIGSPPLCQTIFRSNGQPVFSQPV